MSEPIKVGEPVPNDVVQAVIAKFATVYNNQGALITTALREVRHRRRLLFRLQRNDRPTKAEIREELEQVRLVEDELTRAAAIIEAAAADMSKGPIGG